jgi:hypothetical protein
MLNRLKVSWKDPAKRPALVLGFGAVGLAVVLLVVAIGQLTPSTPSATPTPTVSCVNCPPPPPSLVPKVLHLRDRSIFVEPVNVTGGKWASTPNDDKAEWVFGTLINYVVGLSPTQQNNDMLQALSEGDQITLDLSNGQTLTYVYAGRQFVSPTSTDIFQQSRPGLTVVLLGDTDHQRLVVTANYSAESEVGQAVPGTLTQINTPIELGNVKVTALSSRLVLNAPGVPVGSAFYMVDFAVENTGADPIDVSQFVLELRDYANQIYKLSDDASKLGPSPPPTGEVAPGMTATFLSGFEVPANVTGPVLVWNFRPTPAFKAQASVAVPLIGPTPTPDPRSRIAVQITQAYFNSDQTEMIIVGGIGNPTNAPIVVNESDITLATPDGVHAAIRGSDPQLPLTVGPGQNVSFTLRFSRLPTNTALLTILLSSFQFTF